MSVLNSFAILLILFLVRDLILVLVVAFLILIVVVRLIPRVIASPTMVSLALDNPKIFMTIFTRRRIAASGMLSCTRRRAEKYRDS